MRVGTIALLFLALSASAQQPELGLTPVARGLDRPVAIAHAGDTRLFIVLQRGQIVVFDGNAVLEEPFLDIRPQVACCNEQGLLSIAFHPDYARNGYFYVSYSDLARDLVVVRYSVSIMDANQARASSAAIVLTVPHDNVDIHYGGQLAFGRDGFLYLGTGDGTALDVETNHAQDLQSLLGKVLRIDVDRDWPYAIPPSNPFVESEARPEIWAYGLRNPWRFSFDRENGDLWIADVGQGDWEEVNLQPASSGGGENYGWRDVEGRECFMPRSNCRIESITDPVTVYPHEDKKCSVIGGYRYRGSAYPRLRGTYIYGDFCSGLIAGLFQYADAEWLPRNLTSTSLMITSFGEDAQGELYVAGIDGRFIGSKTRSGTYPAGALLEPRATTERRVNHNRPDFRIKDGKPTLKRRLHRTTS